MLIEPGAPFFQGPDRPREVCRLAYSSISAERSPEGIAALADGLAQARDLARDPPPDWP